MVTIIYTCLRFENHDVDCQVATGNKQWPPALKTLECSNKAMIPNWLPTTLVFLVLGVMGRKIKVLINCNIIMMINSLISDENVNYCISSRHLLKSVCSSHCRNYVRRVFCFSFHDIHYTVVSCYHTG